MSTMGDQGVQGGTTRSTRQLMAATSQRDGRAFAELYDRFAPRLLGLIVKILGDRQDSEDLLQEVFREIWFKAERYDATLGSPEAWLTTLARFRAIDLMRRRRSWSTESVAPERIAEIEAVSQRHDLDLTRRAHEGLATLPEEQRDAIKLTYLGGLTMRQIADLQDVPLGTAKTRIRQGMSRLRAYFQQVQESPS